MVNKAYIIYGLEWALCACGGQLLGMVILGALGGGIDILYVKLFQGMCSCAYIFVPETPDSNTFTICKNNIWLQE